MRQPISLGKVFEVMQKLETSQLPNEDQPVGGYGAGIAIMLSDGQIILDKVGRTNGSPVRDLEKVFKDKKFMGVEVMDASVLLGHVRFPSREFMNTAKFKETAQPYVENFKRELDVISDAAAVNDNFVVASAHNGFIRNYLELKQRSRPHTFETERFGLVDSEVVPHYFGELLNEVKDVDEALNMFIFNLQGSNSVAMIHVNEENAYIHLIHKGKTRGLYVWANSKNEVIFCTRREPVEAVLGRVLSNRQFKEKAVIKWQEDATLKLSFSATFQ